MRNRYGKGNVVIDMIWKCPGTEIYLYAGDGDIVGEW
jgi:hypothetical protein